MIDRELLQGFLRIGFFVGGCSFIMLFIQPRNSPEFIISLCSTLIGGVLISGVILVMKLRPYE
jgi:hypothetical protein